jgi:predicted nucleotidyltransferase
MDNNLKIINYLGKNMTKSFTMHELSKILKIPYATFYRTILKMKDIINTDKIGHSNSISLNLGNSILKHFLIISSDEEKKEFLKKQPIINKIALELNTNDAVILFGSYAKHNQKENSDIDLLIINNKGNKSISFSKYELLFKKKINPIFVTGKEFYLMLQEKDENLGKQVLNNHIILNNPETLWECVLNGKLQKVI